MKKLLLLIMCLMTLTSLSAQKSPKPINLLGKSVSYLGASADKLPSGDGVLTITNSDDSGEYIYTLSGVFSPTAVTEATFQMKRQNVEFKGNVGYFVDKKLKSVTLTLTNGEFTREGERLVSLVNDEQLVVTIKTKNAEINGVGQKAMEYAFDAKDIELAKRFAGDDNYTNFGGIITLIASKTCGLAIDGLDRIVEGTMTFSNGACVIIRKDGTSNWKRANGDVIVVDNGKVSNYAIFIAEGVITHDNIRYKFANGAEYFGSHTQLAPTTLESLIDLKSINWEFNDDVVKNIVSGKLTLANQSIIKFEKSEIVDFTLKFSKGCVSPQNIEYTFPNGIKYCGGYNDGLKEFLDPSMLNPESFVVSADMFYNYITKGTLYFSIEQSAVEVEANKQCDIRKIDIALGCVKYSATDGVYAYNGEDGTKVEVELANTCFTTEELMRFENNIFTRENFIEQMKLRDCRNGSLILPNGEYIKCDKQGTECYIIYDKGNIAVKANVFTINHEFENGNKYSGTLSSAIKSVDELHSFKGEDWKWADFKKHVFNGTLTLANGTTTKYIDGMSESEYNARIKKYNELKATDFKKADCYNVPESFQITYQDLAQMFYDEKRSSNQLYVKYSNGDILYYIDSFMNAPTYNYFKSLEYAPDLYSKDEYGRRVFASDKLEVLHTKSETSVKAYNPTTKTMTVYDADGKLQKFSHTYTSGDFKSIDTYNNKVVYADGSYFEGAFKFTALEEAGNVLNSDERIKNFGITLSAGPEHVIKVDPVSCRVYDSSKRVIAIYQSGRKLTDDEVSTILAREEAERKAEQERLEAERKAEAAAKAERAKLEKKYGAKYVKALYDNNYVIEGTPLALLDKFIKDNFGDVEIYQGYSMGLYWRQYDDIVVVFFDMRTQKVISEKEYIEW
ncbi:MAG: hypothetical protein IKY56_05050 [Alistipes sp.]|nr:hypothetical protein [Alistipes sp.]